jgi:hypothetical protein
MNAKTHETWKEKTDCRYGRALEATLKNLMAKGGG